MSISRPCSSHTCTRAGLPMSAASLDTAAANPTTLAHPPCCGTPLHFHRSAVCPPATSCTVPQRHHHLSWPQSCPANSAIKSAWGCVAAEALLTPATPTAAPQDTTPTAAAHHPCLVLANPVLQFSSLQLQARQVLHEFSSATDVLLQLCKHQTAGFQHHHQKAEPGSDRVHRPASSFASCRLSPSAVPAIALVAC